MLIGVPKEIKNNEFRVGMTPNSVSEVVAHGHSVMVQKNAGLGIGCTDEDYKAVGATVVESASTIFEKAEMIVKVKEPQPNECKMLREGQILFTYLHLAPDLDQTEGLLKSGCIAIAYETVTDEWGGLPLLAPMSEVAGRLAIQAGARYLEKPQGGRGVLLGGVTGVEPANVVVIGGGVVGTESIRMAMGLEAQVTVLDTSIPRLRELKMLFGNKLNAIYSTRAAVKQYVTSADLVIGGVLIAGAETPKLINREMLKHMHPGSVIVDVSIDQGGCFETSKPTTHEKPIYVVEDVIHYCVANMPGAVPRTSTFALNNATLPFIVKLANLGYKAALLGDPHLLNGLNVFHGKLTNKPVCSALHSKLDFTYVSPKDVLTV
jgi:alanine dehydrogenase